MLPNSRMSIDELFRQHYAQIYRLGLSMSGNPHDAEDIVQETFAAVIKALPRFRAEAKVNTWIYRIALRVGAKWLSRHHRRPELSQDLVAHDQTLPLDLIRALGRLSLSDRAVILLVTIEGMSHADAATVLAVAEGTVASRLHYARKRLSQLLDV